MGSPSRRRRRRIDLVVGLAMAVVVGLAGFIAWRTGASQAASLDPTPADRIPSTPPSPTAVPAALHQIWTLPTDAALGAVVSPYGAVITTSEHRITGHRVDTGAELWSYDRSDVPVCGVGSAATDAGGSVRYAGNGVVTVFATSGWCSQVMVLDPATGQRLFSRTSPNRDPGVLIFGGPYTGWVSADLLEVWRSDFVRVSQYGNQPNPVDSTGPHTGCRFGDAALADNQLATIEHCDEQPGVARLVLNYADLNGDDNPVAKSKRWDPMHFRPLATVNTGSPTAVLVGISHDRVAILVTEPTPAMVTYDAAGTEVSRVPVDIPATQINATAAAGITPSTTIDGVRYTLVGDHLLSVSTEYVKAPAPPSTGASGSSGPATSALASTGTVTVRSPRLDWISSGALGLPGRIADTVLVPNSAGLTELRAGDGKAGTVLALDRGSYRGRVDVAVVGAVSDLPARPGASDVPASPAVSDAPAPPAVVVEVRGDTVVGYAGS